MVAAVQAAAAATNKRSEEAKENISTPHVQPPQSQPVERHVFASSTSAIRMCRCKATLLSLVCPFFRLFLVSFLKCPFLFIRGLCRRPAAAIGTPRFWRRYIEDTATTSYNSAVVGPPNAAGAKYRPSTASSIPAVGGPSSGPLPRSSWPSTATSLSAVGGPSSTSPCSPKSCPSSRFGARKPHGGYSVKRV